MTVVENIFFGGWYVESDDGIRLTPDYTSEEYAQQWIRDVKYALMKLGK